MKLSLMIKVLGIYSLCMFAGYALSAEPESSVKKLQYIKHGTKTPVNTLLEKGVNAYFDDVIGSKDPTSPISCGLFRIEKGKPLVYAYDYDDIKLVLDGSITFSDGTQTVTGVKGDILFLPKGSKITFSTKSHGFAWACGQRKLF